jgi:hypothetical protein
MKTSYVFILLLEYFSERIVRLNNVPLKLKIEKLENKIYFQLGSTSTVPNIQLILLYLFNWKNMDFLLLNKAKQHFILHFWDFKAAVFNLGYAYPILGVHKNFTDDMQKKKKNTHKNLIWVEFLIFGYARGVQVWYRGTHWVNILIWGYASLKRLQTAALKHFTFILQKTKTKI